jgi:hypothetical protein
MPALGSMNLLDVGLYALKVVMRFAATDARLTR